VSSLRLDNTQRKLAGVVFLVALTVRLLVAAQPVATLVTQTIYDDAFYYFVTASHIVREGVVSFDGINPTNGFHPLWMGFNIAAVALLGPTDRAINALIFFAAVMGALTTSLLFGLCLRLVGHTSLALAISLLYALNAKIVLMHLNGLESVLVSLTLTLVLLTLLSLDFLRQPGAGRGPVVLGGVCALAVLARTDSAVIVAVLLAVCGLAAHAVGTPRLFWRLGVVVGVMALLTLPWFAWMWLRFGALVQMSGMVEPVVQRQQFLALTPGLLDQGHFLLSRFAAIVKVVLALPLVYEGRTPRFWLYTGLGLYVLGGMALLVAPLRRATLGRTARLRLLPALGWRGNVLTTPQLTGLACGAAILLFLSVHVFLRWGNWRGYYAASLTPFLYPGLALGVAALAGHATTRRRRIAFWGMQGVALTLIVVNTLALNYYPLAHQRVMMAAATWLAAHTEPGARIGSYNAGILGYYSQRLTVNLDGKINNPAAEARMTGDQTAYVQAQCISVIADFEHLSTRWLDDVAFPNKLNGTREQVFPIPELPGYQFAIYRLTAACRPSTIDR